VRIPVKRLGARPFNRADTWIARGVLVPATDRGALRAAAALARKKSSCLSEAIMRAVAEGKHGTPSQIQEQTISIAISRRDSHHTQGRSCGYSYSSLRRTLISVRSRAIWLATSYLNSSVPVRGATGAIAPDGNPPHDLSRDVIEAAIQKQGFQLWRQSKRDQSNPTE
jgi:hypothetical protein